MLIEDRKYQESAEKVCAVILAAGFSTRMKRFKPLLPFGEGTVLSFVLNTYRRAGIGKQLVVGGHNASLVEEEALRCQASFALNKNPELGMFSSVCVGLSAAAEYFPSVQFFAIHPVDIPLVSKETLVSLVEASASSRLQLLKPSYCGEFGHPPLIARNLLPLILNGTWSGGLRDALSGIECQKVEVSDQRLNLDMDHPEDYSLCLETLKRL